MLRDIFLIAQPPLLSEESERRGKFADTTIWATALINDAAFAAIVIPTLNLPSDLDITEKRNKRNLGLVLQFYTNGRCRVFHDIRFGLRLLWKDRGYALTAILTLAICIGANTAIFTIVNSVLLKPLAVPDSSSLLLMSNQYPK